MQPGWLGLKYLYTIVLDILLAGVYKEANPRAAFIYLNANWLYFYEEDEGMLLMFASVVGLEWLLLRIIMHVKVYLVFELQKQGFILNDLRTSQEFEDFSYLQADVVHIPDVNQVSPLYFKLCLESN